MATPDFILALRAMIGHHPLWLPGVTALVTDGDGRVLWGRRADCGLWALPSGIPEPGEEMAAACAREVEEETGVRVDVQRLLSVESTAPVHYPNGDVSTYVDHFFACRALGGDAHVADDESLDVAWFPANAPPAAVTPRTPALLERAAAGGDRTWFRR